MTPLIATHALLATCALITGAIALWARRMAAVRPALHRAAGYAFTLSLLGAALTACFLRDETILNWHGLTLVHLLIPLAVLGLAGAFIHLKRRNFAAHRRTMQRVYLGACVLAGLFTLVPNRLIGHWLWGTLGLM
ncbi:MAG: DUF2306 domain-containing protein [Burkholderiaceae bacterium]|jgi:uncharacterized membrane protein|nr:DUF2306 domain-containing protein [Burkholderiaceae bacterium]